MKIKDISLYYFGITLIFYIAGVVGNANFNPFQWSKNSRITVSIIWTVLTVIPIINILHEKMQK